MTTTTESIRLEHAFAVHESIVGSLVSLGQWNAKRKAYWDAVADRVQHPELYTNGLKCPACFNGNLYDTGRVISTGPNILQVKCQSCKHKDRRYE